MIFREKSIRLKHMHQVLKSLCYIFIVDLLLDYDKHEHRPWFENIFLIRKTSACFYFLCLRV